MQKDPLEKLSCIYKEYAELCAKRGEVSEEDTRANILDRILHEVLEWPRDAVHREVYLKPGYLDYELVVGTSVAVIEAKKSGKSFVFPYKKNTHKSYKISGSLSTDIDIKKAIEQTQHYCSERGIRFGITTNGYSFIIFRAIIEGMSWRDGSALVFVSPKDIESRFTEFWNILSYEAVYNGKLREHFSPKIVEPRGFHRPIDGIVDAEAEYGRNPLNAALGPYVERFFGDIAAQDDIKLLEHCYVHTRPLQIIDQNLNIAIRDSIPKFAPSTTKQIETSEYSQGGKVESQIRQSIVDATQACRVVLIMGGIGSGKSTFLKRFFKVVIPDLLLNKGPIFDIYLDFLGEPETIDELRIVFWRKLENVLRSRDHTLQAKETLEALISDELGVIKGIYGSTPAICETKVQDALYNLLQENEKFANAALVHIVKNKNIPVIVFDNVDHLKIDAEIQIFTYAQQLARARKCISIIVLREESYCAAKMQKHLTAYNISTYHLSSPRFVELLKNRLDFASNAAAKVQRDNLLSPDAHRNQQVLDFFQLLGKSILDPRENYLARLIESISFGNARLALKLLEEFMTSDTTNIEKILAKYYESGSYLIPYHEFTKSIVLGPKRFYKESRSVILNLFAASDKINSSHFTSLRILRYLSNAMKAKQDPEGFVSLQQLISEIVDIFDNEQDCIWNLERLIDLRRQLVELDTHRSDTLNGASSIRITASGMYYHTIFAKSFAYLDLMWQDTPFNDDKIAKQLARKMHDILMKDRFDRVEIFLDYLEKEEKREFDQSAIVLSDQNQFYGRVIPYIKDGYERDKGIICAKLCINLK